MFDAADGDDHPIGAIVELVADFIHRFVEKISFEQNLEVLELFGHESRTGSRLEIILEKEAAHQTIPNVRPAFEKWNIFRAHRRLPEGTVGRVLEGPHHPRNIAQSRALELALAHRPCRFAFEIEDNEILSGG